MKKLKFVPLFLSLCLIVSVFSGCATTITADTNGNASPIPTSGDLSGRDLTHAASYDDVFKALNAISSRNTNIYGTAEDSRVVSSAADKGAETGAAPAVSAAAPDQSTASSTGDYSQTNVQVNGVDEGDIVKTDGQYIYVLRQNELILFKAEGASTTRISSIKVGTDNSGSVTENETYINEYASDIYVTGDTAVIVTSYSSYGPYLASSSTGAEPAYKTDIAYNNNKEISKIYILDISDRTTPSIKAELGQDGYVLSTRLVGSTLYMISNYYVYSMTADDNGSYIPSLYTNGVSKLVGADTISIMPYGNTTSYTVVSAYDLPSASLSANTSILGGGSTVYMNENTLYIANSTNSQTSGAPYTESIYTVIDYTSANVTDITSFDVSGGKLALKASGSVPGMLNNQFNMDEYDGNLRVVTTTYSQSWSEYTDKAKGFVNYTWKDPLSANALYVLDSNLKAVGSVENLAPGEQVYSARFDGTIGYIVTFKQVDPLFAVDLSDPTRPTILSTLKIPGFSEYLHVYTEGRLFGLGMDADAETGRTNGMKLSMFDTTNLADVTEKHSLLLDTGYSNALYNHKAILISADKNIIAFPADNGYDIYGYSDEQGFVKKASVSSIEWSGDSRGFYIGDNAYIVDNQSISVLDMTNFTLLNRIAY